MNSNKDIFENLRKLEENWSSHGAKPFDEALISFVENLVPTLSYPPKIFPTGRESIQLEYEKPNGEYLEFEIYSEKKITMFQIYTNGSEETKDIYANEMNDYVIKFNK